MCWPIHSVRIILLLLTTLTLAYSAYAQSENIGLNSSAIPVLWRDPGDISVRDLRYGPGSPKLAPAAPFTFIEEVKSGESPKIRVRDARGVKWVVKLGAEAQAETVSTRLVWSIGYSAEEAYYFDRVRIRRLPKLSRGQQFVTRGTLLNGARFEPIRADLQAGPSWDWAKNPFQGTQELSGLKVMMILLNNYDARSNNNKIYFV